MKRSDMIDRLTTLLCPIYDPSDEEITKYTQQADNIIEFLEENGMLPPHNNKLNWKLQSHEDTHIWEPEQVLPTPEYDKLVEDCTTSPAARLEIITDLLNHEDEDGNECPLISVEQARKLLGIKE